VFKNNKVVNQAYAGVLFLLVCATVQAMETAKTFQDLQDVHTRSLDGFFDLLCDREPRNGGDPYAGFHYILGSRGNGIRPLKVSSAYYLGLMCKSWLGVPEKEYGPARAQQYFSFAARHGHRGALEELARCACELGDYEKARDAWQQQRFLEIGDLCVHKEDDMVLEEIQSALRFISCMSGKAKQRSHYKEALEAIQRRLHLCAGKGGLMARCLLARLYEVTGNKRLQEYVRDVLIPELLEGNMKEVYPVLKKTSADQALQAVAEMGDMNSAMLLGFVLFYEQNYNQAYFLLKKASQSGLHAACVYRMLMEINGLGVKQSFAYVYAMLHEWSKNQDGRALIAEFASMVDKDTLDILVRACSQDQVRYILGIILYHKGNGVEAYKYLSCCEQDAQDFYVCYCRAKILSKDMTHAGALYARVLASPDADKMSYDECLCALRELARAGEVTGTIELCRVGLGDSVPLSEIVSVLSALKKKTKEEQLEYIRYAYSSGCMSALRTAHAQGNARASLILAMLCDVEVKATQQRTKKIMLMQEALECIRKSRGTVMSDNDLASLATHVGYTCRDEKLLDLAISYMDYAVQLGSCEAMRELSYLTLFRKDLKPEDMQKALACIEESASQGNIDDMRLLAQVYRYDAKIESSATCCVQADMEKSYAYALKVLDLVPDDKVASRIVGCFLVMYGGYAGIPVGQDERAYALLSHGLAGIDSDVLPTDYYAIGCLCLRKGELDRAKFWFDKDRDFSLCACGRAVIDFIESSGDGREQAYNAIEASLSQARKYQERDREHFFHALLNEKFIALLQQDVLAGNTRARVIMARIAMLTHRTDLGMSREQALEYLVAAAENGCASALSFLGCLYSRGTDVQKIDARALCFLMEATRCKQVPQHIIKESMEELIILASRNEGTKEGIIAAYNAASLLLCTDTPENISQAISLINRADVARASSFKNDAVLSACAYESGAIARLKSVADRGNSSAAAVLGFAYWIRYMDGFISFQQFTSEGCKFLEQALHGGSDILNADELSKRYLFSVRKMLVDHPDSYDEIRCLLERAHQLDENNAEIACFLASLYRKNCFSGIPLQQSVQKSIDIVERLASNSAMAALETGICYLVLKAIDGQSWHYTKAMRYMSTAAIQGDRMALLLLVNNLTKESNTYTQSVVRQVLKYIDEQLANPETSRDYGNYILGLKALLMHKWDDAFKHFDQLIAGQCPDLLVEAAMLYYYVMNDIPKAVSLTVKAIDNAGKQNIDLLHAHIRVLLQSLLFELDAKSSHSEMIKKLAACIRLKLKQYNYVL
jgi:TPR repeat protein